MGTDSYFDLQRNGDGRRRTLLLVGEMDMSTSSELGDAVAAMCRDGVQEIVVDLRQLSFIDSSGVRSLLSAQKLCSEHGSQFVVDPDVPGPVKRVFEVAGVGELFELP